MNPKIDFGSVSIDLYKYSVQRNVSLGIPSAGKTFANKFVAEVMMDSGIPVVIIDPVGKWRYLNTPSQSQNGKGYPVIVVGKDADVELSVDTIADITRLALANRSSLVIDLYNKDYLEIWDQVVSEIAKVLLYENETYGLRHLFIEEAAEFIHQQGKKTESSVWLERLTRMAGNAKLGITFINQTSEQLSKAVMKLCAGLMIGKQTELNSLKAIQKRLSSSGVDAETVGKILASLPHLQAGEFYFWSEGDSPIKTKIPLIRSFHPSRNDITETDTQSGSDIFSVISQMNNLSVVDENEFELDILPEFKPIQKATEMILEPIAVDWSMFTGTPAWYAMSFASQEKFANGTVKSMIDNLVSKGYTKYNHLLINAGSLENKSGQTFNLNTKVECDYAKALLYVLGY